MKSSNTSNCKQQKSSGEKDWNLNNLVSSTTLSSISTSSLASSVSSSDVETPSTMTISTIQSKTSNSKIPLKSTSSTYYMDKKYSLSANQGFKNNLQRNTNLNMRKIDDVKSFISNAYDHINESKEQSVVVKRSSSSESTREQQQQNEENSKKLSIKCPIEVSDSVFVNSANRFLLKKYSNKIQSNSISLSSYDISNNECSDSGYTKSITTTNSAEGIARANANNSSGKLERPSNSRSHSRKSSSSSVDHRNLVDKLKATVEFSEERRKLLLSKFTEAQELLQVQLKRLKQTESELKSKTKELDNMKNTIGELQSQNSILASKLVAESKNYHEIHNQSMQYNEQLRLKIADLESLLRETKAESIKLKTECRDKNDMIDELLQSKTFTSMEKSQLEIDYSQLEINIDELRSENSELKLKITSLEKDLGRYKTTAKEANEDYENMQQLLLEREKNWSNLRTKLEETMSTKEKLYNEHLDLIQQFNEYKQGNHDSKKELNELENLLNLKTSELETVRNERNKLLETNDTLKSELSSIKRDKESTKSQLDDFRDHIGNICSEFSKIKEEKEKQEIQLRSYVTNYSEERFQNLQNDLNQLRIENQEAESTIQSNEEEIEKMYNQLKSKDSLLVELNRKLQCVEKIESELENVRNEKFKHENEIKKLKTEIDELMKKVTETKTFKMSEDEFKLIQYEYEEKIVEFEEEVEKLVVEKQYFQTKCDENEQLIQFLETQLKVYTKKSDSSKSLSDDDAFLDRSKEQEEGVNVKSKILNEVDSLKMQIKTISEKCTAYEEKETKLAREIMQLNQTCQLYEDEIRGLKSNLDDHHAYKADYENQLNENTKLKNKFKDLEKELDSINLQHQKSVEALKQSKENELFSVRQKLEISETSLKEALDKVNQISKDYIELKTKCNDLELFIEREKSSKLNIENECTELKNKLKKSLNDMKETQLSYKRNEEMSMRYKSQMNEILTEMQIIRAQLDDSLDVQNKQDELIKSLKLEIELKETKKMEKIKKYENEINRLQEALEKLQGFISVQFKEDYDSNDSSRNDDNNIVTLTSENLSEQQEQEQYDYEIHIPT